ncbi:hypothetical protein COB57_01200 [Candidatus Peregrinibacteria bacterium]|nr:MAG: hypothetical protein COB57_05750 [Candidatus Peregrinibacteria bacterium]PCI25805.1 MAG: hypothetical protein COB57_01200 [Candidatus Peregrinibacteria bacterium]
MKEKNLLFAQREDVLYSFIVKEKRFDFSAKKQIGFWKKIRIHASFLRLFEDALIFLFFALSIFIISVSFTGYEKVLKMADIITETSTSVSTIIENPKMLHDSIVNISDKIQGLSESLDSGTYDSVSQDLFILSKNIKKSAVLLDDLDICTQTIFENDFSCFLNVSYKYQPLFAYIEKNIENTQTKLASLFVEDLDEYIVTFQKIYTTIQVMPEIFGDRVLHRYVILFQNAYEKRATGGFVGSFYVFDMNDGYMRDQKFYDIYQFDGQSQKKTLVPALAQSLVGKEPWSLRDANISPYFETSAQYFLDFLETAGSESRDTVIAIDNRMLEDFLQVFGSIIVDDFLLDHKNISFYLSYMTEGKFEQSPKEFIVNKVFPEIWKKAKEAELSELLQFVIHKRENIQVFSKNDRMAYLAKMFEFGQLRASAFIDPNTIFVSQTSISGNKSDAFIKQEITYEKRIIEGVNKGVITFQRQHDWGEDQEVLFTKLLGHFGEGKTPKKDVKRILGKGSNHALFQIFFPQSIQNVSSINTKNIRSWQEENHFVYELDLPLLEAGASQNSEFSFDVENEDWELFFTQ